MIINDFEQINNIVNGYWYTFEYNVTNVPTIDRFPFIYCINPFLKNVNCFEALNLHHLPLRYRDEFLILFDKLTNFVDEDIRKFCSKEDLKRLYPPIELAFRVYDRKKILKPYRIKNKAVPYYLEYDGDIIMKNPSTVVNNYFLNRGNTTNN